MEIVVILEDHKPTMSLLNAGTVDANDVIAECRVMLDIIRASQHLGHQEPRTVLREVLRVLLTLPNATLSQAAPRN